LFKDIILGTDDATELKIDPSKTIIWTGAGVSCIPPSSLPLGNGLTDAYLEYSLGPKWKDFVALWNNYFPQIKKSVKNGKWYKPEQVGSFTAADVNDPIEKVWDRPRLEYVIGELDKLDKFFNGVDFHKEENKALFSRGSVLHALTNFANIEPCDYHFRLADLSRAGAVMITANFDDGIEKALGIASKDVEIQHGTPAVANGQGGFVYHFHGIATDTPDNLGATIGSMSKGLDEDFQKYLRNRFMEGYSIVFIGYGGVDFFDVAPFFNSLDEESYPGKALYLQYCSKDTNREEKKKEEKPYRYLLKPFKNQYIAYADTDEFFHAIYGDYTLVTTPNNDCGAYQSVKEELEKIADNQVDKDTYYFLNMFRLCSQLNINPGRFYPDWIERISGLFTIWEDDGKETIRKMTVVDTQKNDGIIDDIYSNNWHDSKLSETGMRDKLQPYIADWEKKHRTVMSFFNMGILGYGFPLPGCVIRKHVDKTVEILDNQKTDEHSIDISRSTVMYLCGYQTKLAILLYRKSHGLIKQRMQFLRKQIERLLRFPFTRFRYRTHYLSLCRQMAYIDGALCNGQNGYQGDIQAEWDICMQTPILFDAGQVLNCRLVQAEWYGLTDGVEELNEIRNMILDLRKARSGLGKDLIE